MAQAGISVQLNIPEIYRTLCPKCKRELKRLIREKLSDQMVSQMVGEEKS